MWTLIEIELADEAMKHCAVLDKIFGDLDFEDFTEIEYQFNFCRVYSPSLFDEEDEEGFKVATEQCLEECGIDYHEVSVGLVYRER